MNKIENKTIFVTGGAGFIASHIIDRLIDNNKVTIYDNYTRDSVCFDKDLITHENLTLIKGDVLDSVYLSKSMKGSDIVVHCAAIAGIFSVSSSPTTTMKVNLIGTYNVLEAALEHNVKQVIDFSTSEVYGSFVYKGKETDNTTIGPVGQKRWTYAIGKLASEHLAHSYAEEYDLNAISVRPFNVYGPRQIGEGAIQQMIIRALSNEDITIYNDGLQIRAWCYVSDFTDAFIKILERNINNQTINIGNPQASTNIVTLAQKIIEMTDSLSTIVFKKHPGEEIEVRIPDIEKAHDLLDYIPAVGLEEGLRKTIKWYKQYSQEI